MKLLNKILLKLLTKKLIIMANEIKANNLNMVERIKAPSPKIFKKIQWISGALLAVGTAIVGLATAPVAIPAIIITIGGYLIAVGTVGAAIGSLPVDEDKLNGK